MFTSQDLQQLSKKGITTSQVESQLQDFVKGFPFLKLKGAAAVGNGIQAPVLYLKTRHFQDYGESDRRSRLRLACACRIVLLHGLLFR